MGQYIPFPKTKSDRIARGDPRPSIEERYPNVSAYYEAVNQAIEGMVAGRLMLREDARPNLRRLLHMGLATGAIKVDPASQHILSSSDVLQQR